MSAKIHFYIRTNRLQKDGSAPIFLFFIINRNQRFQVSINKYVSLKKEFKKMSLEEILALPKNKREELFYWDTTTERVSKGAPGAEVINTKIDLEKAKALKIIHFWALLLPNPFRYAGLIEREQLTKRHSPN